jgi:signal transduction histidine kinase
MRRRLRRLPLGAWLGVGLVLVVAAPVLSAGATWWAISAHQRAEADSRLREAAVLIEQMGERLHDAGARRTLLRKLAALHVEAEVKLPGTAAKPDVRNLGPADPGAGPARAADGPRHPQLGAGFATKELAAILAGRNPKRELARYETEGFRHGHLVGTLFVERPSGAVRLAAACAAGLLALALALILGVVLLRRWVVAPLEQLAADAERIAGGELDVAPISSPAREVAEVGAALRGMADGLRGALAEQHAAEQQRRFLVSAIAHDLRTPLFTLRGSLEAIEQGIGNGDHLHLAQDKARLLDRLVDDLFSFSRLEYTGVELTREALDAVALAHEAANTVDSQIAVVAAAPSVAFDGDHAALLRILVNLLENAVRHARSRVELHVRTEREEVLFEVLDDGPGIAPDDLPQLFEPLFRADRTRSSATGGAGLGLAIVQRLIAAHGGSVHAENRSSGGAHFVVRCPRRPRSRDVGTGAGSSNPELRPTLVTPEPSRRTR